jgi:hypothetical protein
MEYPSSQAVVSESLECPYKCALVGAFDTMVRGRVAVAEALSCTIYRHGSPALVSTPAAPRRGAGVARGLRWCQPGHPRGLRRHGRAAAGGAGRGAPGARTGPRARRRWGGGGGGLPPGRPRVPGNRPPARLRGGRGPGRAAAGSGAGPVTSHSGRPRACRSPSASRPSAPSRSRPAPRQRTRRPCRPPRPARAAVLDLASAVGCASAAAVFSIGPQGDRRLEHVTGWTAREAAAADAAPDPPPLALGSWRDREWHLVARVPHGGGPQRLARRPPARAGERGACRGAARGARARGALAHRQPRHAGRPASSSPSRCATGSASRAASPAPTSSC